MTKVAVVVSHPIQHFCPQYSSWASLSGVDLNVFFASNHGLAPYADKDFDRTIQWAELVMDFPHQFLPGSEGRGVNENVDSLDLEAELSKFEPALVVMYGYSQPLQRRALRWAKRHKVPKVMISDAEMRIKSRSIKAFLKSIVLPSLLRGVDSYLTVGDANEHYYRYFGASDDQFVRCFFPIDTRLYGKILQGKVRYRNRVRELLGIPEDHKVILNVGKLVSRKRQVDLLELSRQLQSEEGQYTVILAGTGVDEEKLRSTCTLHGPGGVVFAGFLTPALLAEYYCAADVYVHCSELDPHSLAISEAIYCGLPVVVSDKCGSYGPTDDVRTGLNGFVYCCGDISDLKQKLGRIMDSDELMKNMATASRKIGLENQNLAHNEALPQLLCHLNIA